MAVKTQSQKLICKLLDTLGRRYGEKPRPANRSLMELAIFYLVYYRSGVTAARRVLKALHEEYVDLNELRVSTLSEIRATLARCAANQEVAHDLRSVLRQVFASENTISFESVEKLTADMAKRYLSRIERLPAHAVDYMLLTWWKSPVLPMDPQVARAAARMGLVDQAEDLAQVQKSLMKLVQADSYFDFYTLLLEHAGKVCGEKPHCERCVLLKSCRTGKAVPGRVRGK